MRGGRKARITVTVDCDVLEYAAPGHDRKAAGVAAVFNDAAREKRSADQRTPALLSERARQAGPRLRWPR